MNALTWLTKHSQAVIFRKKLAGLTACSQMVELSTPLNDGQRKFIFRQQSARATLLAINYAQEAYILQHLDSLPFTPKVYYQTANSSLLTWLEGKPATAFDPDLLEQLALQLATLHAYPLPKQRPILQLAERCQLLWDRLTPSQQHQLNFCPPFKKIEPLQLAICHHDLHLANLIQHQQQLFIIDWEYSAISDPALEIALFFQANTLNSIQKPFFLTAYLSKINLNEQLFKQKMAEYTPAIQQLSQLWYALSEAIT
ncbi:choline/ethanolamine kinase family protein [[Haemophilus] ducreyi]|uniref:choline/ethanolamine kinase family protein n=1 Tax=Haemophilus ducreyi TaxID=730 RepID=UPI000654EE7C|nr:choline/ethanolamine kinase family protein [[Haemophilus] ducreyi]AKO45353.1 choline kinase [[Haemophilus] ducreyi]AKO46738.1 choline kinase [[Haemophilus] ducreyi]AKO48078.1 choline kinase [[Haemophilus] ducreyi]AKO49465.1 choline kinase [[Haemophilus] ducreyi]OOS03960.1 LPS biosynthesis choline kinase [[Haemophilus] ducreyi]